MNTKRQDSAEQPMSTFQFIFWALVIVSVLVIGWWVVGLVVSIIKFIVRIAIVALIALFFTALVRVWWRGRE